MTMTPEELKAAIDETRAELDKHQAKGNERRRKLTQLETEYDTLALKVEVKEAKPAELETLEAAIASQAKLVKRSEAAVNLVGEKLAELQGQKTLVKCEQHLIDLAALEQRGKELNAQYAQLALALMTVADQIHQVRHEMKVKKTTVNSNLGYAGTVKTGRLPAQPFLLDRYITLVGMGSIRGLEQLKAMLSHRPALAGEWEHPPAAQISKVEKLRRVIFGATKSGVGR